MEIEIKDLEMQAESCDRAHIQLEIRYNGSEPELVILKDGSYEHFVDISIDKSGKIWLRERPRWPAFVVQNPETPSLQFSYRNEIMLFDSSCSETET